MNALPPTNPWRASPFRGWPSTEEIRISSSTGGMWQDWQLRCSRRKGAVAPFEIRHLLRQLADHFAARTERFREQRMARRAQLRLPDVRRFRLPELRRGVHDRASIPCRPRTGRRSAWHQRPGGLSERPRRLDDVAAGKARRRSQLLAGDLVTDGAGHAVVREPVVPAGGRCPPASARTPARSRHAALASVRAIGMWHLEHSS